MWVEAGQRRPHVSCSREVAPGKSPLKGWNESLGQMIVLALPSEISLLTIA